AAAPAAGAVVQGDGRRSPGADREARMRLRADAPLGALRRRVGAADGGGAGRATASLEAGRSPPAAHARRAGRRGGDGGVHRRSPCACTGARRRAARPSPPVTARAAHRERIATWPGATVCETVRLRLAALGPSTQSAGR